MRQNDKQTGYISGGILVGVGVLLVVSLVILPFYFDSQFVEPKTPEVLIAFRNTSLDPIELGAYSLYMEKIHTHIRNNFGGNIKLAEYINATKSMDIFIDIWDTMRALSVYGGDKNASLVGIFNENIQTSYETSIPGISEAINGNTSLEYNETNTNKLINGTSFSGVILPGFLQQDYNGQPGIIAFNEMYMNPSNFGISFDNIIQAYSLTSNLQLDAVIEWFRTILYPFVPEYISEVLGFSVPEIPISSAEDYIKLQWAENAIIIDGLHERDNIFKGFEVTTNFTEYSQVIALWDSFTNITILKLWFSALDDNISSINILKSTYSLNSTQYIALENWLINLEVCMQEFLAVEFDFPNLVNFYERLFLKQWMERVVYKDGLWEGFEIYLRNPLDSDDALDLWDETNSAAITNSTGIIKWYKAVDDRDSVAFKNLAKIYNFGDRTMAGICDWLRVWRLETFYTIAENLNLFPSIPIWGTDLKQAVLNITSSLSVSSILSVLGGLTVVFVKQTKRSNKN
ncbi:MAG: hypothetical protein JW776_15575 [Candidatus Lokiarchaeota archaeon]|nr:hypothetical protein [Candidatus Lokiarchaeota archaeon]